ncbi:uncharacterized protein ACIB01_004069 isoform 1-T1 [Guaruba guarouba]
MWRPGVRGLPPPRQHRHRRQQQLSRAAPAARLRSPPLSPPAAAASASCRRGHTGWHREGGRRMSAVAWGREAAGCGLERGAPHPQVPVCRAGRRDGERGWLRARPCPPATPPVLGIGRIYMVGLRRFPVNGQLIFRKESYIIFEGVRKN